jgi:hypothetical protein
MKRTSRHPSEETKQKMAAAQRGKTMSEENKRKLIAANTGRIKTPAECRKISKGLKAYWATIPYDAPTPEAPENAK